VDRLDHQQHLIIWLLRVVVLVDIKQLKVPVLAVVAAVVFEK
jgi:hypothetical protein